MENALSAPQPAASAALPYDLRVVHERLALIGGSVAWDLPQSAEAPLQGESLRQWCTERSDRVSQHTAELGVGLWLVKRELGHGAYLGWLKEAGIPQQRASEAVTLARLLMGAEPAAVPVLSALPQRKLLALAPGGQDLIAALTQDGTLAEIPAMDRDSIRALVRERLETQRLREQLDDVVAQRDAAADQARILAGQHPRDRRLSGLRLAALEEIERLRSTALALARIARELAAIPEGVDDIGYQEACHATVYALQGLQAIVDRGVSDGYALQATYDPNDRLPPPLLSPEEERRVRDWAAQFLAEADLRHGARAAAATEIPRGRKGGRT